MISFNLDIDETVESGVDDLQRIQIDDVEDTHGDETTSDSNKSESDLATNDDIAKQEQSDSNDSKNSSGNNSNDTICPPLSPNTSPISSPLEDAEKKLNNRQFSEQESEINIVELITKSAWLDAVRAFRLHRQKWPDAFATDYENHIGSLGNEEDMYAMLNLYCKHLSQLRLLTTHPLGATSSVVSLVDSNTRSIFVMTLTDQDMAKNVSRLMDASLQLLATVKLMETLLTKRKQSMSAQAVATVTERVYKQQEQVTQEIQQHHAHQQILQQQQLQDQLLIEEKEKLSLREHPLPTSESEQADDRNESECKTPPKSPEADICQSPDAVDKPDIEEVVRECDDEHGSGMTETIQSSL